MKQECNTAVLSPITDEQIVALKYLIIGASGYSDIFKKILIFLIDHSENLTQPIRVKFLGIPESIVMTGVDLKFRCQLVDRFYPNQSSAILKAMGSKFHFHNASGWDNDCKPRKNYWTYYLSEEFYDKTCKEIVMTDMKEIEAIPLDASP